MTEKSGYSDVIHDLCTKIPHTKHMPLQRLITVLKSIGFVGKVREHQIDEIIYMYYESSYPFVMYACWSTPKKMYIVSELPQFFTHHISFLDVQSVLTFCIYRMTQLINPLIGYIDKCFVTLGDANTRYKEFDVLMSNWKSRLNELSITHNIDKISDIVHGSNIFQKSLCSEDFFFINTNLRYLLNPLCNETQIKILVNILDTESNDDLLRGYETDSLPDSDTENDDILV